MAKRFDIHEWQAKQRLAEQDDFTPDLEDDELKRSKVQQMMAKEKDLTNSDYLSDVEPKIEGSQRAALEELADKFSLSEILDTLEDIYAKNDELAAADYAGEFAAKFRKWMDRKDGGEEELDEQNVTGTGASFKAGSGEGYATPGAFANNEDDWEKKNTIYEEEYEDETELEKDVKAIENMPQVDKINTKYEWEDFMDMVWDMSHDIQQVTAAVKRLWLQSTLKHFNNDPDAPKT